MLEAPITAVTVFRDGARVQRSGTVSMTQGTQAVVMGGLPASVDAASVRVAARGPGLTLLTVASLIAPIVEATQELRRGNLDLLVIIAASVVLFGLVVLRMAGLVRQQERSVARERTLSAAGVSLVAAAGREDRKSVV